MCYFFFVNYYATLFYIAFVKGDIEPGGCAGYTLDGKRTHYCGMELSLQVKRDNLHRTPNEPTNLSSHHPRPILLV